MNKYKSLKSLHITALLFFSISAFISPLSAFSDTTHRWDFDVEAQYEVSDPALIRANPDGSGSAELILQESLLDTSSLTQYLGAVSTDGIRMGAEQVLELTESGSRYNSPGIFRSRVFDKGIGSGSWDTLFSRVSNALLPNSPGTIATNSSGLASLFRMDNDWIDAVSGNTASSISSTFDSDAVVGTHAGNFYWGRVITADSSMLLDATSFTITFWAKPRVNPNHGGWACMLSSSGSSRLFIGYGATGENFAFGIEDGNGGPTSIMQLEESIPEGVWTMISVVWDNISGSTLVYFNKNLVARNDQGPGVGGFNQSSPLYIGTDIESIGRRFHGRLDELAVWRRALSEEEIGALIDNLRVVQFRLRSSSDPDTNGDFVGPTGTSDSFFIGIADKLTTVAGFNPIHRYIQYQVSLYTDGNRAKTPQIQYVKFVTKDGVVHTDSTAGDFCQGDSVQNVTNAPYSSYTPYLGLSREPNGGYKRSGIYTSKAFDGGSDLAVWERMTWRLPQEIDNAEKGLIGLYHLDGNWVDVAPAGGANNPIRQDNAAFSSVARLGFGSAIFDEATGGSVIGEFFAAEQLISSCSFWINDEAVIDGIMEIGGGVIFIRDHQIVADGYGGNSPAVYVNANPQNAYLVPGWNHVALVWPSGTDVQDLMIGSALGNVFGGQLDELALYSQQLSMGQVQVQFYNAHPISGGAPTFRVRAANSIPALESATWSVPYGDPLTANFSVRGQYFQYEATFVGNENDTPVAGDIWVYGNDSVNTFEFTTDTYPEAAKGDFGGGDVAWFGDEIYVENYGATDPANLLPADFSTSDFLAGLWHFDEASWGIGTVLVDSSGRGRPGSPVNGAASSPNARVGFRSGSFDGVDDYVVLSQITELAGSDFSVGLWFNSRQGSRAGLMSSFVAGGSYFSLELNGDGTDSATGRVSFVINDGVGGIRAAISPAENLNNGGWHHVMGVRESSFIHLYVDGVRVASTDVGGGYGNLTPGVPSVARNGAGGDYLSGFVDEVIVFGSALSSKQVGAVFSSGYQTKRVNELEMAPVDPGGSTIWQTLRWTSDGIYGSPLSPVNDVAGLWHLDEATGVGTAEDATANGNNATVNGATQGEIGVFGSAVLMGGAGDYLSVIHDLSLESANFSVSLWVNPEAVNSRTFVDKSSGGNGYALYTDPQGRVTFKLSGQICSQTLPLLRNQWSYVVATYDGNEMRLYVNGALRATNIPVGVSVQSGAAFSIGRSSSGSQYFRGLIDEVAYHSKSLQETEILDQYKASAGTLSFQVRAADFLPLTGEFYGSDGTSNSYFMVAQNNNLQSVVPLVRYLQVKVFIGTENHNFSPILYGVSVSASRYPESTPSIWLKEAVAYPFLGNLLEFNHDRTYNTNTDVRYQISGDIGDTNSWFYWNSIGHEWSESISSNTLSVFNAEASSRAEINANIGTFYEQVYDKTGGVFRFKAFLKSAGDQQVSLDWVDVTKSDGRIVVEVPNGLEVGPKAWISAVTNTIEWSWAGVVSDNLRIEYSLTGYAGPWVEIASGIERGAGGVGSYEWRTPEIEEINSNVVMRVRDLDDATVDDMSDSPFEITQKFKVTMPNGGEYWYIGDTNVVGWESSYDLSTFASIYMAPDGSNYHENAGGYLIDFLAPNANAGLNTYTWVTPTDVALLLSTNAKMHVEAPGGLYADDSDEYFTMAGVVITSPAEGQKVKRNDPDGFDIEWAAIGAGSNVVIDISLDGGVNFQENIYVGVTNVAGENSHNWFVTHPESDFAVLRIRSLTDGKVVGVSKVFTIAGVDVIKPDGGEEWLMGTTNTIEWVAGGAGDFVSIYFTELYDGTNTDWISIAQGAPNVSRSYDWVVSDLVSPDARVKIVSDEDPNLFSVSDDDFSIAGVRVTYPNVFSDTITIGEDSDMKHNGAPTRWLRVALEVSYDREATWGPLGPGSDNWTLRQDYRFKPTYPSRQTKVRATVIGATEEDRVTIIPNVIDVSDNYFTSAGLLLQEPLGGETNTLGQTYPIKWVTAGAGESIQISYSSDQFVGDEIISPSAFNNDNYPGENTYYWRVPETAVPTENAVVKIVSGGFTNSSQALILRGIRILQPILGDVWNVGTTHDLSWKYAGVSKLASGDVSYSLDGGASFTNLVTDYDMISIPFYRWNIDPETRPTTNAMIKLYITSSDIAADVGMEVYSDMFTLKGIKILSPLAGDVVLLGSTNRIEFVAADVGTTATILYSADGGATFDPIPIVSDMPIVDGDNVYDWAVEGERTPSINAVIKIMGSSGDTKISGVFSLGGIRVDRPMQFDIWAVGERNPIEYISVGTLGVADLVLIYEDDSTFTVKSNVGGPINGDPTIINDWQLPLAALKGEQLISNVVLRVRDAQGIEGFSESFKLVSQPLIEIVSPLGGDFVKVGEELDITWVKGGHMEAADFRVFYSRDGFATSTELYRDITFNSTNNTFSMPWLIENRLGTAQILVTNSVNASVTATSDEFDIVGSLTLTLPNGGETFYAKKIQSINWRTLGSIEYVNLFYKTDAAGWTQLNDDPIENRNGDTEETTSYLLALPDVISDSTLFRVQDANYSEVFDGTKPGPYDDSDEPFSLGYYTILWEVGYFDEETGEFKYMNQLSVTDSSGWSQSGMSSADDDGNLILIERKYPYGTYDTVWYRQFFNEQVDFRWVCDSNMTRLVVMESSETEPDAHVLADFVYDLTDTQLVAHVWIERGGRVLNNPDSATVRIYDTAGNEIDSLRQTKTEALVDGVFRIDWYNILDTLDQGETYLARVEVVFNGVSFSAAVTYTLSLGAEASAIEEVLVQVLKSRGIMTNEFGTLTGITEDFRDNAMSRLNTLTGQVANIDVGVSNLVTEIGDFSNMVVNPLAFLSNQMVDVVGPTLTNIAATVSNINASAGAEQARILNRPTTVDYGSTNTILYKTMGGIDYGRVNVVVESTGKQFVMTESSPGLGIYSADVITDWGLGSYTISCVDPNATDSMVIEVVSDSGDSIFAVAGSIEDIESQMKEMAGVLGELGDVKSMLNSIGSAVEGGSGTAGAIADLESLITGSGGGDASLLGKLSSLSKTLDDTYSEASDASSFGRNAKQASETAVALIHQLLEFSTVDGDAVQVKNRLDMIKTALESANKSITDIPESIGASNMQAQMNRVAKQIAEMAGKEGFDYGVGGMGEGESVEGEEAADEEMITDLNQNMDEMKISLEFLQKLLEENDKAVVQENWIGVE